MSAERSLQPESKTTTSSVQKPRAGLSIAAKKLPTKPVLKVEKPNEKKETEAEKAPTVAPEAKVLAINPTAVAKISVAAKGRPASKGAPKASPKASKGKLDAKGKPVVLAEIGAKETKEKKSLEAHSPGGGRVMAAGGDDSDAPVTPLIKKSFPNVGRDLKKASADVLPNAEKKTTVLAENEQTHEDAAEKLVKTEAAVIAPASEGQSKSNTGQVDALDKKEAPKPSKQAAQDLLKKAVDASVPADLEALDNFKKNDTAKGIGKQVAGVVTQEVNDVSATYGAIKVAPPAMKQTVAPVAFVPNEVAPETPKLDLGKDAVPDLEAIHTDFKVFEEEADGALVKEGITDAELEMVDSGELFEAKQERAGIKKKVKHQPGAIRGFASGEKKDVEKDLQNEEKDTRKGLTDKRNKGLETVRSKQTSTKTELETQREAVATKINGIYDAAKLKIKTKLEGLETTSMKRFDDAQVKYSIQFEDEVNTDINAFKKKRYDQFGGSILRGKDWLMGIDDFPEIEAAFEKAKGNYVTKIDRLIVNITKDNEAAITECKTELTKAKKEIAVFVSTLKPSLAAAGTKAMTDMNKKLEELDSFIDKKKEELVAKLQAKKEDAIKKIDKKIDKMKESMSGALSFLVGLLVGAMLKFVKWVLGKFGMKEGPFFEVLDKGAAVIKQIVLHPIDFIMNLLRGVGQGIKNFGINIKNHLILGVTAWLTGAMAGMNLKLPEVWDLKGIFQVVMQVLGLTWDNIRLKLVEELGEEVVQRAEQTVDIIKRVMTEGPIVLWELLKEKLGSIKETILGGIRDWIVVNITKQGLIMLASFLNPAGAIIQAIKAIYKAVVWLIDNFTRIIKLIKTIFGAIADIAFGKLGAVAAAVEKGLGMMVPIIIDFMAKLLGLGGIVKAIQNVIEKIRTPINKIIKKVIKFIVSKAKGLLTAGKAAMKKGVKKVKGGVTKVKDGIVGIFKWWKKKKKFKNQKGENHTLYFKGEGKSAKMTVASDPTPLSDFIVGLTPANKAKVAKLEAEIYKLKYKVGVSSKGKKTKDDIMGLENGKLIASKQAEIAVILAADPVKIILPKSKINIKSTTVNGSLVGKSMTASPLSMIPDGKHTGSTPRERTALFDTVSSKRINTYVRGHLLNHHLFGPGTNVNLTPITIAANNEMSNSVEEKVKAKVLKEHEVVSYTVTISYGGHAAPVGKDIPEEKLLATKIDMKAHTLEKPTKPADQAKTNMWTKKKANIAINPITHVIPTNDPVQGVLDVNLSDDSAAHLKASGITGMDLHADKVIAARKLGALVNYDQIKGVPPDVIKSWRKSSKVSILTKL